MLSVRARENLRPFVRTLGIIVIALSLGITFFGIFAAVQNAGKPQTRGTNVNYLFLGLAGPMFVAGFVVPRLLPKGAPRQSLDNGQSKPDDEAAKKHLD